MKQQNIRTYLLYAVGEISLVVIGILIALQINNWNESRKVRQEEVEILNILQEDLKTARSQSLDYLQEEVQDSTTLVRVLNPTTFEELITAGSADSIVYSAIWEITHEAPVITAYNDLKNAGKTGLIRRQEIREQLSSLEVSISSLNTLLADRLSVQQIRIDDIASNAINFLDLISSRNAQFRKLVIGAENNYENLIQDQQIRNLLGIKLILTGANINYRRELLREIEDVLRLIETELARLQSG